MKPYYESDGITIYHGDCREVLPLLDVIPNVILTDPPWPLKTQRSDFMPGTGSAIKLWSEVSPLLSADRLLLWLPIHCDPRDFLNPLEGWPYLRAVYIRRAIPGYFGRVLMDGEWVHVLGQWPPSRKGRHVIPGGLAITYVKQDRHDGHPGPRSLIATKWLLQWWSDPGDLILDPFGGSGTTALAAKELGRKAILIEIHEPYCEIAAERLSQGVLDLVTT